MRIGAHVSTANSADLAIDRAVDIGAEAVQIFGAAPQQWRRKQHAPEAIAAFRLILGEDESFVPAYIRPLFCRGVGPFRWAALTGDPEDIRKTDEKVRELLPDHTFIQNWLDKASRHVKFQGLPARVCWLGLGERDLIGLAFNEMVASGEVSAPIAIGRDHMDAGSVASPNRETEDMLDGSDAVSDWPLLNFALNVASGASWVSFHHGGGVGIGFAQHAGQVIVADGTDDAATRLKRVLTNDPLMGIFRHVDAGYDAAIQCAKEQDVSIPMRYEIRD